MFLLDTLVGLHPAGWVARGAKELYDVDTYAARAQERTVGRGLSVAGFGWSAIKYSPQLPEHALVTLQVLKALESGQGPVAQFARAGQTASLGLIGSKGFDLAKMAIPNLPDEQAAQIRRAANIAVAEAITVIEQGVKDPYVQGYVVGILLWEVIEWAIAVLLGLITAGVTIGVKLAASLGRGAKRGINLAETVIDPLETVAVKFGDDVVKILKRRQKSGDSQNISLLADRSAAMQSQAAGVTRTGLLDGLTGLTRQGDDVAAAIRQGDIKLSVLGDDLFEKAWRLKGGTGSAPQAFAYGDALYVRGNARNILSEIVHEGTHGLDYLRGSSGTVHQWEKRAYYFERQFQLQGGGHVEFQTLDDMLRFILEHY